MSGTIQVRPAPNPTMILVGAAVMMSLAMGMRQCLGLFLPPMTRDLGITASDFTFAIAVQNVAWGVFQAPLGAMADRWGLRPVMVGGAFVYVLAALIMACATGVAALTVSGALIGIAVACTSSSLAMTATARAVSPERRSVMLGIVGAFSSVGMLVLAPLIQAMLAYWDWRIAAGAMVVLSVCIIPMALMTGTVDRMPQPAQARPSFREVVGIALANRSFVVLCCTYFVCGLQLVFLNTHLPNYLALCGQDPMLGATALSVIGGVNIIGSYSAGWLGGRYPKYILLGCLYIARSVTLAVYFMLPPTPTSTIVFAAVMGMLWLGVIPLVSGYVAELFGTRTMATILGLSFVIHQAGSVTGAFGGGVIFDISGSYDAAWRIGVLIGVAAGIVQIVFGGPARPRSGVRPALAAG